MSKNVDREQLAHMNEKTRMKAGVETIERKKHIMQMREANAHQKKVFRNQIAAMEDQIEKYDLVDEVLAKELEIIDADSEVRKG